VARLLGHSLFGVTVKKTKKICDQILERFGDGEYLRHICTGKGVYPDQATFWRWRLAFRWNSFCSGRGVYGITILLEAVFFLVIHSL